MPGRPDTVFECVVRIPPHGLEAELVIPVDSRAVVVFAHGSGSSRHSPRNRFVAQRLHRHRLATLLLDLLTHAEDEDRANRFDIGLLAERLAEATAWLQTNPQTRHLPTGYFGASTGAAAALIGSVQSPGVFAVVSRGGRPDLASDFLARVQAPVLLVVGSEDTDVLELNRWAQRQMSQCETRLAVVPGATHLFEEPGTLQVAADLAADWFTSKLPLNEVPWGERKDDYVNSPRRNNGRVRNRNGTASIAPGGRSLHGGPGVCRR